MVRVFLSIGANEGDALANVRAGIDDLLKIDGVSFVGAGLFYESEPLYEKDQDWFVNSAVAIKTDMEPGVLLARLKEIEAKAGRRNDGKRNCSRPLDIDIIFYGDTLLESEKLTLPHKDCANRRFVLKPVCDIDKNVIHPVFGKSVEELLAKIPEENQKLRRVNP